MNRFKIALIALFMLINPCASSVADEAVSPPVNEEGSKKAGKYYTNADVIFCEMGCTAKTCSEATPRLKKCIEYMNEPRCQYQPACLRAAQKEGFIKIEFTESALKAIEGLEEEKKSEDPAVQNEEEIQTKVTQIKEKISKNQKLNCSKDCTKDICGTSWLIFQKCRASCLKMFIGSCLKAGANLEPPKPQPPSYPKPIQ